MFYMCELYAGYSILIGNLQQFLCYIFPCYILPGTLTIQLDETSCKMVLVQHEDNIHGSRHPDLKAIWAKKR